MDKLSKIEEGYKYEIKGNKQYEFVIILGDVRDHLYDKVKNYDLEKDFQEQKEKIEKEKKKENTSIEIIEKELNEIILAYNNIKTESQNDYEYYLLILFKLAFNYYDDYYDVKGAKETFFKVSKDIIDTIIKSYIDKEKKLIAFKDKVKDLIKLFF